MGVMFSQLFPPSPSLTEANLPSQKGKVFIVTGGASGVGHELAQILYHKGGKVYIAGRSESNARQSIEKIKQQQQAVTASSSSSSTTVVGELHFLHLELDDLGTIKPFVEAFKARESRLDILFNNAGVSLPPRGSVSKQNHELQLATNCLGPHLLTQLLLPTLEATAAALKPAAVRIIWTSSQIVDLTAKKGGLNPAKLTTTDQSENYTVTKVGNWFLGSETAKQVHRAGILCVTQNPGNLKTNLLRTAPTLMRWTSRPLLHEAKMGAYTELWAGLSESLGMEESGCYIVPWGRIHPSPRKDLVDALTSVEDGGTGTAKVFREWCEQQTVGYR